MRTDGRTAVLTPALDMRALAATPADRLWMRYAIEVAEIARSQGAMPFGCVVVNPDGRELAMAGGTGSELDPTAHSEMLAIRHACASWSLGCPKFLRGCAIYSTHQLCPMCSGAVNHAKLSRVVFGSYRADLPQLFRPQPLVERLLSQTSHPPVVVGGVCRTECIELFMGVDKWD